MLRSLIIEDDADARGALERALSRRGYSVVALGTGEDGLDAHRCEPFDLILVDWTLPGMNGLELCRRVRSAPGGEDPAILLVTGRAEPEDVFSALEAGASDYLYKPLEPRQLELRLLVAEGHLRRRRELHDRVRSEATFRAMASDRLASVGTLAAGVAHELNNPLAYVLSNIGLLREEIAGSAALLPAKRLQLLRELVDESAHGVERMKLVVADLKTFSRIDDERRSDVDPSSVIRSCLNACRNEIRHRARLVTELETTPAVRMNESRLAQAVLNLLLNASQALPEGHAGENWIVVRSRAEGSMVVVEVQDSGPGIPPQMLDRIFDPFFSTKDPGEGTGLGLSICQNVVSGAGGRLEVQSEPGEGALFRLSLPAAPAAAAVKTDSRLPRSERTERLRLFVIDDEPLVARSLKRVLRGHEVTLVSSGREAIDWLTGNPISFDVILCDIMMPEVSGMEVYEEVTARRPELAERFVFMTGGAFTAGARAFLDRVDNDRIEKPFDPNEVREVVRVRAAAR